VKNSGLGDRQSNAVASGRGRDIFNVDRRALLRLTLKMHSARQTPSPFSPTAVAAAAPAAEVRAASTEVAGAAACDVADPAATETAAATGVNAIEAAAAFMLEMMSVVAVVAIRIAIIEEAVAPPIAVRVRSIETVIVTVKAIRSPHP